MDEYPVWMRFSQTIVSWILAVMGVISVIVSIILLPDKGQQLVRLLLLIFGIGFLLSAVTYWIYLKLEEKNAKKKVIILVANFDGPEPVKYQVTSTIINNLKDKLRNYDDVDVIAIASTVMTVNFCKKGWCALSF
jgi:hypothetical protein